VILDVVDTAFITLVSFRHIRYHIAGTHICQVLLQKEVCAASPVT
jgi:hypothetical protein